MGDVTNNFGFINWVDGEFLELTFRAKRDLNFVFRPSITSFLNKLILFQGSFIFFDKPLRKPAEYMRSGVLSSEGFFTGLNCLSFHYCMQSGGYLRVFTKEAESKEKNPYVLIWEEMGLQGNRLDKMEKTISGNMIKVEFSFYKFVTLLLYFLKPGSDSSLQNVTK